MRKCSFLWVLICLLLLAFPQRAAAAGTGSLKIIDISQAVTLYQVAYADGTLTEAFAAAPVEDLLADEKAVENARQLAEFVQTEQLSGQRLMPEDTETVIFEPLQEGYYLVCSEDGEFAPFLATIPTRINGEVCYEVQADPKEELPTDPDQPTPPGGPDPEIPQTGNSVIPQYVLLAAGILLTALGFVELLRGREKKV